MKKAIIALAALGAAAGISIGAFIAVRSGSEKENKKETERLADNVLFDFDAGSINKLDIINSDGSYTVENNGELWELKDSSDDYFDINQISVQSICTYMSNLTADTSYGKANDENKEKYGLVSPYTVTAYNDESSYTIYIGDKSPTGDYYYAYTPEKNNIYAIFSNDAESMIASRLELKNNDFINCRSEDIVGLTLKRDGDVVYDLTFDQETRRWNLPEKYDMLTINQTRISSMLTVMTTLTAEEMIEESPDDMTKYGFDKPTAEFTVKLNDGTERNYLMSRYGQNAITYTYVYLLDSNQVETYFTSDIDFVEYDMFDIIMQIIECANINTVKEFEISCDTFSDAFTIDKDNETAECRGTSIDLSNAELYSFFENFYNSFSYVRISDVDVEATPELTDPVISVKYTLTNESVKTIDFVRSGTEDLCYVFVDGEYTGTMAKDSFLYGSDSVNTSYELLCRQAGIQPNTATNQ